MKNNTYLSIYLAEFFLEWEMFQTKDAQKIKTHILCSVTLSRKSCRLWENVENIIYNKPTRCNSGSIVFIKNYKYAVHVLDALCVHLQEHYKL